MPIMGSTFHGANLCGQSHLWARGETNTDVAGQQLTLPALIVFDLYPEKAVIRTVDIRKVVFPTVTSLPGEVFISCSHAQNFSL